MSNSARSSQLPMMKHVSANCTSLALLRSLDKNPEERGKGSWKNVVKKLRICSMRSDMSSSMPNW